MNIDRDVCLESKRMKKKPLVSVILPVYNEYNFLQEAIDSVINQSYPNIEIIIVNDGSTSRKVEEICLRNITKITYLKKENGGVASALNCAINASKGEYIARMDGDDISYPERIWKQVEFLEKNEAIDICGTNFAYIDENDSVIWRSNLPLEDYKIKIQNIFQNSLCHPSVMFRRKVFNNNLRYDENIKAEDYELWLRIEEKVKFANLRECLFGYRKNTLSVTNVYSEEIYSATTMLIKEHLNRITDNAFENISEYCFGNINYIFKHTHEILLLVQKQLYICSTIVKWNQNSGFYHSGYLLTIINERWIECLKKSGLWIFLINENKVEFLQIQYFVQNQDKCEKFYGTIAEIFYRQMEMLKVTKQYLIYSIGTRGQDVYRGFLALIEQKKIQWNFLGFGDKKEETKELFSYPVYSLNKISNMEFDYIIIASNKYFEEIKDELIAEGVKKNKILDATWMQWIDI